MYQLKITVFNEGYDDSGRYPDYKKASKDFYVEIIDYCQPKSVEQNTYFDPPELVFTIDSDTSLTSSLKASWTTVPTICNISYIMAMKQMLVSPDPNLIIFQDLPNDPDGHKLVVTVQPTEVFYGGDFSIIGNYNAGEYFVVVHAWADNNFDTGSFQELKVTVVDPCATQTLIIDDSIFKTSPGEVSMTYYVGYPENQIFWSDTIVTNANVPLCGPLHHQIYDNPNQ